jgi:N-acetylglucosaminyl-diphospho-decaprenol L-rhamnosyltransferase
MESAGAGRGLAISIVSHGHGASVQALLNDMAAFSSGAVTRVVLTMNLPEPGPTVPVGGWPFALEVRRNAAPLGFGANHNRALDGAREAFVGVLNPDVVLAGADPFPGLLEQARRPGVGCAYPEQVNAQGYVQDSERALPTPAALWRRRVLGQQEEVRVDWVNAACMVLPQPVWQSLEGFDEAYFMYCEDVDLCLRLRRSGWELSRAAVRVVHAGQRASHRRWDHLYWHVTSLLRLWRSPAYRWACKALPVRGTCTGNIGAP